MDPSPLAGDAPFSRLPLPPSRLIGREREVALALGVLRRPDVRLLTLTGAGGIGKTRLALAIAGQIGTEFADGVRYVALAPVLEARLVAPTVARAVGLHDASDGPIERALVAALQPAEMLLVLDNFEQVVAAAALLSALLAMCPRLTMLVTSRVLLRIDGEHALPVPPLDLPDRDDAASDRLRLAAAVQLFVERGQAIAPSFALTDEEVPLAADICRRLDGLPLAIELAAARVTHLSLAMLRERLERRLPLLTGGGRDRPRRLQTMRDAIAWSHDLLSPQEQVLFRRLAVFAGGCTLEAAEWVTGSQGVGVSGVEMEDGRRMTGGTPSITHHLSPDTSTLDTLDVIATLVEASLLRSETDRDGSTRYWMLETIREFAEEQLAVSGEAEAAQRRHAAYFTAFAERYSLSEMLPEGDLVVSRLDAEHANLRVALAWLEERDKAGTFVRLAAALGHFWIGQGHLQEGRDWLERALAHSGAAAADRARALVVLGMNLIYQGANEEAERCLAEGLAGCRALGDAFHAAVALLGLGGLATMDGDYSRGATLLEGSRATAEAVPDRRLAGILSGWVASNLAVIARAQGHRTSATEHLEEALRLQRAAGYTEGMILALGDRGDLARDEGDYARALACYGEALSLGHGNPRRREVIELIEAVGILAAIVGQAERGIRLLGAAAAQRERLRLHYHVRENAVALEQAAAAARTALGATVFAAAWEAGRGLGPERAITEALEPFPLPVVSGGAVLTPRELEILRLLAAGMTDPAIAAALYISVRTVESHVTRIFAKLDVHTRTAAAAAASAAGLVELGGPSPA